MGSLHAHSPADDRSDIPSAVGGAYDALSERGPCDEIGDGLAAAPQPPLEPYTGRFRSLVPSAPLLAPWSAPPAPTGFTSSPPAARGMPSWWSRAVRGGMVLTLALMGVKVAMLAGLLRL